MTLWRWLWQLVGGGHKLHVRYDSRAGSKTVVLLHGIAANGQVWQYASDLLKKEYRVIVVDLLGFGESPKPVSIGYDAQDHAKALRRTLKKLRIRQSYIVGHSMGAIIALQYAVSYPQGVRGLICVAMPAYDITQGNKKSLTRYRTNAYVALYKAMIDHPDLTWATTQGIMRRFGSKAGLSLEKVSMVPFQRSLMNTIIHQSVLGQLTELNVPAVLIYGTLDPFVIQEYYKDSYIPNKHVTFERVKATHVLDATLAKSIRRQLDRMQ
jgi:cis-3-alkyl-4-acyloxetan-2-one decarboxylase